ncbi:MAG: hypothetical protein L6R28_10640 [Planctomycetes bacterium]|nr:hypothetical protein [Planctomycetota bacterium]
MRMLRMTALALLLATLSGCCHYDVLVKLKHDGSGEVVYTIDGPATGPDGQPAVGTFAEDKQIKEHAAALGEGVEYVSHRKINENGRTGIAATYKFAFANNLRVNLKPANDTYMTAEERKGEEYATFNYVGGDKPSLTVMYPERKEPRAVSKRIMDRPLMDEEKQQMAMYNGMVLSLRVELLEGENIKADSTFVDGNTITLHKIDFTEPGTNEARFKEIFRREVNRVEDVKPLMKNMRGCKINLQKDIKIEFTPKKAEANK